MQRCNDLPSANNSELEKDSWHSSASQTFRYNFFFLLFLSSTMLSRTNLYKKVNAGMLGLEQK